MIAIGLSKQQALDADPKGIQQINFTGNLDNGNRNTPIFFIIEEPKETFKFFTRNCKGIVNLFCTYLLMI